MQCMAVGAASRLSAHVLLASAAAAGREGRPAIGAHWYIRPGITHTGRQALGAQEASEGERRRNQQKPWANQRPPGTMSA